MNPMDLRIGEGWDTHQLVTGRKLILGGVEIPHSHGLLGHSDADAVVPRLRPTTPAPTRSQSIS